MNTCLLITGNPAGGFECYGPFGDPDVAADFADTSGFGDWWVVKLNSPRATEESDQ